MHLDKLQDILRERKVDTVPTQQMYEWVYQARKAQEQDIYRLVEAAHELTAASFAVHQRGGEHDGFIYHDDLQRLRAARETLKAELNEVKDKANGLHNES